LLAFSSAFAALAGFSSAFAPGGTIVGLLAFAAPEAFAAGTTFFGVSFTGVSLVLPEAFAGGGAGAALGGLLGGVFPPVLGASEVGDLGFAVLRSERAAMGFLEGGEEAMKKSREGRRGPGRQTLKIEALSSLLAPARRTLSKRPRHGQTAYQLPTYKSLISQTNIHF
jgi:hypothetical protein